MGGSAGGQRLPSGGLAGQGGSTPTGDITQGGIRRAVMPSMPRPAVMPPQGNFDPTKGTGYGGIGTPQITPSVITQSEIGMPAPQPTGLPAPPQPNPFQRSSSALNQAQRTLTGLSQFQPQQMRAARTGPTATYAGATVAPAVTYGGAQVGPTSQMQAAQLGPAERMQSVGAVQAAQAPDQIAVDRLQTQDISAYMNPYQQQVIEAGQADIERQRQMASENLASQAQKAGAFGGSRQAVQEGVLAGEALRQAGQLSAQQRQTGFQQAVESGKFDIGQTQAARTLASQQGFDAQRLGQQAREAAAAREQAARSGNMQAANQFAQQQAQLEQQASQANMAALNAATSQQAGLTQAAGLSSMAAQNAAAAQQAGLTQAAGLSNQAAINQALQAQAARQQAANQTNFQGQFTGAGIQQGAASGLSGLGQQQFNIGQSIQQQQMQQGALQRALMQGLIDAGQQNFGTYTGAPTSGLGTMIGALTGVPQGTSTSYQPGLFNYLQLGASMFPR